MAESSVSSGSTPEFELTVESPRAGVSVVAVRGEVDLSNHEALRDALVEVSGDAVIVDLSSCSFIDSSGIRALLQGSGAQKGMDGKAGFSVVADESQVARILQITGIADAIPVHSSVNDALDQLV